MVFQKVDALFALFEAPLRDGHFAPDDFQIRQDGEVLADHVLVEPRLIDDFGGPGFPHRYGPQNGKVVAGLPEFVSQDEVRLAVKISLGDENAVPDISPEIDTRIKLKKIGGRPAQNAVAMHEGLGGHLREDFFRIHEIQRFDEDLTRTPAEQGGFVTEDLRSRNK